MDPKQILDLLIKFSPFALKIAGVSAQTMIKVVELLIELADETGVISGKTAHELGEVVGVSKSVFNKATKFLEMFGIITKTKSATLNYKLNI
jgi:hypothetical protein